MGELTATFDEAFRYGCIQTGADMTCDIEKARARFGLMFYRLREVTGGDICDECPVAKSKCMAFATYYVDMGRISARASSKAFRSTKRDGVVPATVAPGTDKYPGKSVAQIATILGISKSAVRRMKASGQL